MVSISGNTLLQLVTALVSELGAGQAFTATSDGAASNSVIASSMIDTEAPVEKYGGYYLYNTNDSGGGSLLGQQQRVKRNGLTGATGAFTTAANFTGNSQNGASWLMCGVMPVLDADGLTGMRTCVNRALRKLWYRHWYPFTGVDGQTEYDLGALWWASRSRFIRLMDPDPGGTGHPPISGQNWDVVQNGDVFTLQLTSGYPTASTFWLIVEAPLNFRMKISGTWANQASPTAGLVVGADTCLGAWNDVLQCSLYECMKVLAVQAGGDRKAYWEGRRAEQSRVVSQIKLFHLNDDGEALGEGPTNNPDYSSGWYGPKGFGSL